VLLLWFFADRFWLLFLGREGGNGLLLGDIPSGEEGGRTVSFLLPWFENVVIHSDGCTVLTSIWLGSQSGHGV